MLEIVSHSEKQTEAAGEAIGSRLGPGEAVALFGEMGAGKTALTRGICRGLGSADPVSSPTFSIVNEYSGRRKIYHFDMYRISGAEDLESTGYYEYLKTDGNVIVEWSENIRDELPDSAVRILMENGKAENERVIKIFSAGEKDAERGGD